MEEMTLSKYASALDSSNITLDIGKVTEVRGSLIKGFVPGASLGSICSIYPMGGQKKFNTEVVGFEGREVLLMPLGEMHGTGHGSRIVLDKMKASALVSDDLLGRVLDGQGHPIDDKGEIETVDERPLYAAPKNPLKRPPIK